MKAPKFRRAQVPWMLCAVAVLIVGGAWVVVDLTTDPFPGYAIGTGTPPPRPVIDERHEVREELDPVEGPPMALPGKLPPGYGLPDDYSATAEYHARSFVRELVLGKDERALARHAHIPATGGTSSGSGPGGVSLCVEDADDDENWCPALPGRDLVRTLGSVRVVIQPTIDAPPGVREAWQSITFTTDLDKVTWLH
ncbi:hypothetical protein [Actinopolymorpha pittospori]|uniref:Uncharacterized protein n=1 Tax=Actinopolymorpha pittospori TaxID=648752 RepID=A0A927N4L4_9ACTN|nr:hypothetical protein [Actinopolymorpha pittospori]MBE1612576.1 hypothetical protein [Actinopolymorpha pittospori]